MNGQIKCSHILQKHTKSRNPKDSYRNKVITRSPEEALENIKKIRQELVEKGVAENFAKIAKDEGYPDIAKSFLLRRPGPAGKPWRQAYSEILRCNIPWRLFPEVL